MADPLSNLSDFASPTLLAVREAGLGAFPVPEVDTEDPGQLPAGRGQWAVPPYQAFVGLINQGFRAFHWSIDEAIKSSRENAESIYRDPVVRMALADRFRPTSQLAWYIDPLDESDPAQVRAAAKVTKAILKTPKLQEFHRQHLNAVWYGKAAVQSTYQWDSYQPDLMAIKDWSPIHGDSLVARWSGDWGVLVNSSYEGHKDTYSLGYAHYFTPEEMEAVTVHTFEPQAPDFFDSLSAGALKGSGLRGRLFWFWFYKSNLLALLLDYMERLATGVWIGFYDQSNPEGQARMEAAIAGYRSKQVISIPRNLNGDTPYGLEIKEPGTASPAILENLIQYFDSIIRQAITGHPVGDGTNIGVGGDTASFYGESITTTTKSDATGLQEDYTRYWLPTLYRYNCPGVPPGRFVFTTDHPNADKTLAYATQLREMGWPVDLDHLAMVCGIPKASLNATISTKIQPLSPVAVDQVPQDTPMVGSPAPADPNQPPPAAPVPPSNQVAAPVAQTQPVGV